MKRLCALLVLVAPLAYAKGNPDLIVLSGHGLAQPVEVNDAKAIEPFSPFGGAYIDWQKPITQSPVCGAEYEAQIFMQRRPWWTPRNSPYNRGDLEMMYGFRYCEDPKGGPGYIFLPGKNDKYGAENRGTILLDGQDGRGITQRRRGASS